MKYNNSRKLNMMNNKNKYDFKECPKNMSIFKVISS